MRAEVIIFGQSLNSQFLKGLTHSAMLSPRPGEVGTPHCSAIEDKEVRRSNLNIKTLTKQLFTQGEQECSLIFLLSSKSWYRTWSQTVQRNAYNTQRTPPSMWTESWGTTMKSYVSWLSSALFISGSDLFVSGEHEIDPRYLDDFHADQLPLLSQLGLLQPQFLPFMCQPRTPVAQLCPLFCQHEIWGSDSLCSFKACWWSFISLTLIQQWCKTWLAKWSPFEIITKVFSNWGWWRWKIWGRY